ncbi:energy transducer TonB [Sphingomonas trueperi]|uniref:Protein TonB n=2 Tax=Sphingomonas trueperi TaxID=53317 RepID=A0A7X5XW14_9SPHN|nr:energy transducer TonB [Sphingomonas trueperi]NJB96386.1 protein TonB [Sphingomonas trueperi]
MMSGGSRARGAAAAIAVEALLAALLFAGLRAQTVIRTDPDANLLSFDVPPPPPPPAPEPAKRRAAPEAEGASAPPNRVSKATEVVAPPPPVVLQPPPLVTAPKPATASDSSSGAAPVAGPGTGAGGEGDGTGSGGRGNGPGGGGGVPLRWIGGGITDADYPRAALNAGASGTVGLRFVVGVNGRVSSCTVTRSSGNRDLDETTCKLIRKRFRYVPSKDAAGRPYADTVTGEHRWDLYERPDGE